MNTSAKLGRGTITVTDTEDGRVSVEIEFDPPLDASNDNATTAQLFLLEKWAQLSEMEEENNGCL